MVEKQQNCEQTMRRQHHEEIVSLQMELHNYEKKVEAIGERFVLFTVLFQRVSLASL